MFNPSQIMSKLSSSNDIVDVRLPSDGKPSEQGVIKTYFLSPEEILSKYGPPKINKYKLTQLIGEGHSITGIGKILEIPGETVNHLIQRYQIDVDKAKERGKEIQKKREDIEMNRIQEMVKKLSKEQYIKLLGEDKSNVEIARMVGINSKDIHALKRYYCLTPGTQGRENADGYNMDMIPKAEGGAGWVQKKDAEVDCVKKKEDGVDKVVVDKAPEEAINKVVDNPVDYKAKKPDDMVQAAAEKVEPLGPQMDKPKEKHKCTCNNPIAQIVDLASKLKPGSPVSISDYSQENEDLLIAFNSIIKFVVEKSILNQRATLAEMKEEIAFLHKRLEALKIDFNLKRIHLEQSYVSKPEPTELLESTFESSPTITLNINLGRS